MRLRLWCAGLVFALIAGAATAQPKPSVDTITIYPDTLTMRSGEDRLLKVALRSGAIPPRVEWTVSDRSIASLSPSGASTVISGESLGVVTVTARVNGRTASARVTIFDAQTMLPPGTTRWSVAPIPGLVPRPLLNAERVDDDGPDMFQIQADPMKRFAVVRGLSADGTLVWQATVRGTPMAGDRFGGLLVKLGRIDEPSRTLARFDRPHSQVPGWHYRARGTIEDLAASGDTIYLVEHKTARDGTAVRDRAGQLVVIDARNGLERARFPLPASTSETAGSCARKPAMARRPSQVGSLGAGEDNVVYAELLQVHDSWTRACDRGRVLQGRGRFKVTRELKLVRLTRTGIEPVRTLWRTEAEAADSLEGTRAIEDAEPGPVLATRSGELIAVWTHLNMTSNTLMGQVRIERIVRGAVANEVSGATFTASNRRLRVLMDAFDAPWVYLADGSVLQAIDVAGGRTAWSTPTAALPFEAIKNRGVVVEDSARNQLTELNARGASVRTFPAVISDARIVIQGNGAVHGIDPRSQAVVEIQEPDYVESGWFAALDLDSQYEDARRRFAELLVDTR